jgi:tetratricopeptide (TPR) repeat protein
MALAYKGLSLAELGQLAEAIDYFKNALSIDKHYHLAEISRNTAQELLKSIQEKNI